MIHKIKSRDALRAECGVQCFNGPISNEAGGDTHASLNTTFTDGATPYIDIGRLCEVRHTLERLSKLEYSAAVTGSDGAESDDVGIVSPRGFRKRIIWLVVYSWWTTFDGFLLRRTAVEPSEPCNHTGFRWIRFPPLLSRDVSPPHVNPNLTPVDGALYPRCVCCVVV